MRHNISMLDLRKSPGDVFDHVRLKGDTYVVERNKKPIAIIRSLEADQEHQQLITEKIHALEQRIKDNIALTHEEYDFLVEHADYPEHRRAIMCNQQIMETLSNFGGAADLEDEPLDLDKLDAEIAEQEEIEKNKS